MRNGGEIKEGKKCSGSGVGVSGIDIKAKLWLEKDGEPVFGLGRLILLKKIESSGSISAAAREQIRL